MSLVYNLVRFPMAMVRIF